MKLVNKKPKWEYKFLTAWQEHYELGKIFNSLGQDGWEVVEKTGAGHYLFKRKLK